MKRLFLKQRFPIQQHAGLERGAGTAWRGG
jgi:hypothetical protein